MNEQQIFNTGLQTVSLANANPLEPDDIYVTGAASGYEKIPVFQLLGRIAPKLTIVNFGPGALYLRYSVDGRRFSESELYLPGHTTYRDFVVVALEKIYEVRLRSPNGSCQYQAFEGIFR